MANENKHWTRHNKWNLKLIHIHLNIFVYHVFCSREFDCATSEFDSDMIRMQLSQLMHFYWFFIDFLIVRSGCCSSFLLLMKCMCVCFFWADCCNYLDRVCVYICVAFVFSLCILLQSWQTVITLKIRLIYPDLEHLHTYIFIASVCFCYITTHN